jgi:hypothetical protein
MVSYRPTKNRLDAQMPSRCQIIGHTVIRIVVNTFAGDRLIPCEQRGDVLCCDAPAPKVRAMPPLPSKGSDIRIPPALESPAEERAVPAQVAHSSSARALCAGELC